MNDGDISTDLAFPRLIESERDAGGLWMLEFQRDTLQRVDEKMVDEQFATRTEGNRLIGSEGRHNPDYQNGGQGGEQAASQHG